MNTVKQLIKKYFKNFFYFYRYLRYRVFVVIGLTFLFGLMDGFGLSMFLPLFEIAAQSGEKTMSQTEDESGLLRVFEFLHIDFSLVSMLVLMVVFFALKGLFFYIKSIYDAKVARFFIVSTRKNMLQRFSTLSFRHFIKSDVGAIQNLMTNEINNLLYGFREYLTIVQKGVMVIVYMLFAFAMNAEFAILIMVGGLIFNFLFQWIYKFTVTASRKLVGESNDYQGTIIQLVANFKYLKATGFIKGYARKVVKNIESIEAVNYRLSKLGAITGAIREPILILIVATVILLQVYVRESPLSTIIVSLLFFYRALTNLTDLQTTYNYFLGKVGTMENVERFTNELAEGEEANGKIAFTKLESGLDMREIDFAYGSTNILSGVSLHIEKNKTVALVGESGSGKSTLVNIIAGLLPVDGGEYKVNGQSIETYDRYSFQHKIGYIAQDTVIFNASIYDNVTLWADRTAENLLRFNDAIVKSSMNGFVDSLEEKAETLLGNNGINLSGGQKQRISIARELFKNVDILILDEATSALDSETEKNIQKNIDALQGQFTIVIIAHRLATIKNADSIVLLDNGEILGKGTFEELKLTSRKFERMVEMQAI
ncbi:ABC transporter ATP-binding protein [Sphingobacterium oryzagri]|uniref:ABC transporter ATP-binding protein n=1 Tax=Sphingobacterium oryzagri TaxID=3025669 RepID=A0ABY7WFW0_9SPHI|nr:ABC transporter ATP-binding protein [Sphingobacterium sp. KACC 22765]WDF68360.1 ABC transporter ATP-binding protein [Sphingobacterium sp. KACC 22765]